MLQFNTLRDDSNFDLNSSSPGGGVTEFKVQTNTVGVKVVDRGTDGNLKMPIGTMENSGNLDSGTYWLGLNA